MTRPLRRLPLPGDEQRRGYRAYPGARKIAHLRDNAGAANITLAAEDILTIEHIFTADNITGLRYTRGDFDLIENNPLRAADGYHLRDVVTFAEQLLVR